MDASTVIFAFTYALQNAYSDTPNETGFQGSAKAGNTTPKTVNSLAAIAGHEGDEEPWNITGGYSVEDEVSTNSHSNDRIRRWSLSSQVSN